MEEMFDNNLEILSVLNLSHCQKRIIHELTLLKKQNWYIHLDKDIHQNKTDKNIIITLIERGEKENNNIYNFTIDLHYPFRPPKVKINYQSYFNFLKINTTKFNHILKNTFHKGCFCCESIICGQNWTPSYRIETIIEEIKNIIKIRKNIIKKYYSDIIIQKYLISDISFDEWLF